jgi:hypothetical protein
MPQAPVEKPGLPVTTRKRERERERADFKLSESTFIAPTNDDYNEVFLTLN